MTRTLDEQVNRLRNLMHLKEIEIKNDTIKEGFTANEIEEMSAHKQIESELTEDKSMGGTTNYSRLNAPMKSKINRTLHRIMEPTYFKEIPLQPIFDILYEFGIVPLQEDNTYWDGFLLGTDSHTIFSLGYKTTEHDVNGIPTYQPIDNAGLSLSWYKMEDSGKYEVIAYIS
jgi:hypothetical protein